MFKWWESLGSDGRDWFLIFGFVGMMVVGLTVGIVAGANLAVLPALEPFMHLGLGTGLVGLFGAFVTAMVRLG